MFTARIHLEFRRPLSNPTLPLRSIHQISGARKHADNEETRRHVVD